MERVYLVVAIWPDYFEVVEAAFSNCGDAQSYAAKRNKDLDPLDDKSFTVRTYTVNHNLKAVQTGYR